METNLVVDLLNRIIENKIEIYDEITNDIDESDLESIKEEFLSNYKKHADREIISLILEHTEIVYKWIFNQLKIEYKLRVLNRSNFIVAKSKTQIGLDFEYHHFDFDEKDILDSIITKANQIIDGNYTLSYNLLYLLPFKNGKYFKFGISTQKDLSRVDHINNLYDIDFNKSIVYYGLKTDIQLVENYIKKITPRIYNNPYQGKDGFSEVRDFSFFENILDKCDNQFQTDFSFVRYELKNLEINNWKSNLKVRPVVKKDDFNSFESIPELEYLPDVFFLD
jgi:predicted transcriptional regulator